MLLASLQEMKCVTLWLVVGVVVQIVSLPVTRKLYILEENPCHMFVNGNAKVRELIGEVVLCGDKNFRK